MEIKTIGGKKMQELSLHIQDITENSVRAKATLINIDIVENVKDNIFKCTIKDNGKGMDEKFAKEIFSPFSTTRTTRKVGLGIPLLNESCMRCNGSLTLESKLGIGTKTEATMEYNNIDRAPLGDITSTIVNLIISSPEIDFIYTHTYNENSFEINTKEIKEVLDGVPLTDLSVVLWLKDNINENLSEVKK